ncbi:MAG TPA: GNAT family N-acetyltransferase [Terriglobales bacterium]|jgi:CelD/BcsL family acetyltransferase involved in cellulose biosynthesis/glycosyltransferase involved in cell wall biosynthesis|nr:GNAT family N-acetyltransferase [Terriglobales bacterium]
MLTVLSVAYPFARVAEETAGGAEQILRLLDEAIVDAGMRSIVLAPAGSSCRGELVPFHFDAEQFNDDAQTRAHGEYERQLRQLFQKFPIDVAHFHGVDYANYVEPSSVPNVVTLHLPPSCYSANSLEPRNNVHLVCVSHTQRKSFPAVPIGTVIRNGVRLNEFHPQTERGDYVLALGRICPEKGFHLALDAASQAGVRCLLAGCTYPYPSHLAYFEQEIVPRVGGPNEFVGPVAARQKSELLARARCILVPSLIDETSCIVAMEALASGTPVVAFDRGALREVVEDGRTGFLVRSVEEMSRAIEKIDEIDRTECRAVAESRFAARSMTNQYLQLYEQLAQPTNVAVRPPVRRPVVKRHIEIVDRVENIRSLVPQWNELWKRCPKATTFQRPQWLMPWIETFRPEHPLMFTVWESDRLVGLVPCLVYPERSERVLGFMGGGISDYLDALIESPRSEAISSVIAQQIHETAELWDRADFTDLPRDSVWLRQPWSAWRTEEQEHAVCPTIEVRHGISTLQELIPKRQMRNLRNAKARIARAGGAEMGLADSESLAGMLDALFELHEKRWLLHANSHGVLKDEQARAFHRKAASLLLNAGVLRLYGLRVEGRTIATLYAFAERDVMYCYLQGFDPEFNFSSPGTIILSRVIEDAICANVQRVDFLRGQEAYKYCWGATDTHTYRLTLSQSKTRERLADQESEAEVLNETYSNP